MNFKSIYKTATTPEEVLDEKKALEQKQKADDNFASGLSQQQRSEWVSLAATQSLLKELSSQIDDIETTARNLALMTEQYQPVIKLLVAAETIRKTIEYVRTGN